MVKSWCCSSLQTGAKIIATISLICSLALIAEEFFLIATYGCQGLRSITNQNPEFGDSALVDSSSGHHRVEFHSNKTENATLGNYKFGQFKPKICSMQTAELVLSAVWILSWFGDVALAITLIIGARRRSITLCLIWFHIRSAVLVFRVIFIAIYLIAGAKQLHLHSEPQLQQHAQLKMNFQFPTNRRFVQECRPLDYIYDPVFTLPSNDFGNGGSAGRIQRARMKFRKACMQSSLAAGGNNEQPLQYCDPKCSPCFISGDLDPHRIVGTDRAKFFIRYAPAFMYQNQLSLQPQLPNMVDPGHSKRASAYDTGNFQMDFNRNSALEFRGSFKASRSTRRIVSVGTQTDFREMETQTDPYSPPYILKNPQEFPKVLALVNFTWGRGLPATLEDIVAIERALTRRFLEMNANITSSDKVFRKRLLMLEDIDAQQWADREKTLDNIRKIKAAIVNHQLTIMHQRMSKDLTMRLERLFEKKKRENIKKFDVIRANYLRALRQLERKYSGQTKRKFKRDIILDYIDAESSIYAPLMRNGPNIDQLGTAPDYHFTAHHDYETLIYLTQTESFVKDNLEFDFQDFANRIDKLKPHRSVRNLEKRLKECYTAFRGAAYPPEPRYEKSLSSMITKVVHRSSTPEVPTCAERDKEEDEEAIVLLQSLIRGHAVQEMMRKEAANNMEEILRFKALWESDPMAVKQTINEKLAIVQQQQNRDATGAKGGEVQGVAAQLEGEVLYNIMSFLEQEMTRLLDERKIHALILMAERERRMLEAGEAGRRQKEEECMRAQDEIWRETLGVHQQTVDMYLEDIYLEAVNRSADEESRRYVRQLATSVNDAAHVMEKHMDAFDSTEIAADLVHSFLFPYAVREKHEQKLKSLHGRYYSVATQVTNSVLNSQGVVNDIMRAVGPILQHNLQTGNLSVDASYKVVEQMIDCAVQAMIIQKKKCEDLRESNKLGKDNQTRTVSTSSSPATASRFQSQPPPPASQSPSPSAASQSPSETPAKTSLVAAPVSTEEMGEVLEDHEEEEGEEDKRRISKKSVDFNTDTQKVSTELPKEDEHGGSANGSRKGTLGSLPDPEDYQNGIEGATDEQRAKHKKSAHFEQLTPGIPTKNHEEGATVEEEKAAVEEEKHDDISINNAMLTSIAKYKFSDSFEEDAGEVASGHTADLEDNDEDDKESGVSGEETSDQPVQVILDHPVPAISDKPVPAISDLPAPVISDLVQDEVEEPEMRDPKCIPIEIPEELPGLIGLKAMELKCGMKELGESAIKVYNAACIVTEQLFGIVSQSFESSSDEEPDVELDDDDVQEDD